MLAQEFLDRLAARLAATREAADNPTVTGLLEPQRTAFDSLYFRLNTSGSVARWDAAARTFATPVPWKRLAVFAR